MNAIEKIILIGLVAALVACKKPAGDAVPAAATNDGGKVVYVISSEGLTLREKPSTSARAIASLPRGAKLSVISEEGTPMFFAGIEGAWWQVEYQAEAKQGFIFSGLVSSNAAAEAVELKKALAGGNDPGNQALLKILETAQGNLAFDVDGNASGDFGIHQGQVEVVLLTPAAGKGKIQITDEVTFAAMTNEPIAKFKPTSWSVFGVGKNQILLEGPMTKIVNCHTDACKDSSTKVTGAMLLTIDPASVDKIQVKNIKITGS